MRLSGCGSSDNVTIIFLFEALKALEKQGGATNEGGAWSKAGLDDTYHARREFSRRIPHVQRSGRGLGQPVSSKLYHSISSVAASD